MSPVPQCAPRKRRARRRVGHTEAKTPLAACPVLSSRDGTRRIGRWYGGRRRWNEDGRSLESGLPRGQPEIGRKTGEPCYRQGIAAASFLVHVRCCLE